MVGLTRRQFGFAAAAVGLFGIEAVAQPVTPSVQLPDGSARKGDVVDLIDLLRSRVR
jgi:hypothetical protein